MSNDAIIFGDAQECNGFRERHSLFLAKLPLLQQTTEHVFRRTFVDSGPASKIVFFLGRLCVDEFCEVLLLCANGCGIAAMKLLRGLYERAVNLAYIAKHPDKADEFVDYSHIQRGKWLNHLRDMHDVNLLPPEDAINQIDANYQEAKRRHQEPICKVCGTTRVRFSWTPLDIKSMASDTGLSDLYFQCYFRPTLQAHSTFSAITSRIKPSDGRQMIYEPGPQHKEADFTLFALHDLMLRILKKENEYFRMGLEDELRQREDEFQHIWHSDTGKSDCGDIK